MATASDEQQELTRDFEALTQKVRKTVGTGHTPLSEGTSFAAPRIASEPLRLVSGHIELVVITSPDQDHVISRTEQHGGHYDVDLNLSLSHLDEYQATAIKRLVTTHLRSLLAAARQENAEERIKQLIKAIAPPDPFADLQLKVAESTAVVRREFLDDVPVLTSAEIHANAGLPGANPSQTVHRWRKQGKIFAVTHGARDLYPAFQFGQDGRPLALIAEVLDILKCDPERTDWDNALWFAGESGWLDGKAPLECLRSDPEGVRRAAQQEVVDEH